MDEFINTRIGRQFFADVTRIANELKGLRLVLERRADRELRGVLDKLAEFDPESAGLRHEAKVATRAVITEVGKYVESRLDEIRKEGWS